MPHRIRPMTALLVFTGINVVLVSTITSVKDFDCFHPYWERRICIRAIAIIKNVRLPLTEDFKQHSRSYLLDNRYATVKCKAAASILLSTYEISHPWPVDL